MSKANVSIGLVAIVFAVLRVAVQARMYVYPSKGQSAQQQRKDEGECHQ